MNREPLVAPGGTVSYAYRPSLFGAAREFNLTDDGIEWAAGRKSGHIPFGNVRRLRMSFKPTNMQSYRFLTEMWAVGAPKIEIASSSCKSLVDHERLDQSYSTFVEELHRRINQAAAPVRFERGSNRFLYWPGLAVFLAVGCGLCALIVRALQIDAIGGAAFVSIFLGLFLWQGGRFLRRNRPDVYRPNALPAEVMPNR